jgi:hypothetical protein
MRNRKDEKATADDLMDNMISYVDEFIEGLHKKDQNAIAAIDENSADLQDKLETLMNELAEAEDWSQDDLIELASVSLLIATSMGATEDETETEDNESDEESDNEGDNDD